MCLTIVIAFNAHFDPQQALAPFPTLPKPVAPVDLTYHAPTEPGAPPAINVPAVPDLQYVSQLLDGVKNVLGAMLGGEVMPAALAQALRDRAYTEANREEAQMFLSSRATEKRQPSSLDPSRTSVWR